MAHIILFSIVTIIPCSIIIEIKLFVNRKLFMRIIISIIIIWYMLHYLWLTDASICISMYFDFNNCAVLPKCWCRLFILFIIFILVFIQLWTTIKNENLTNSNHSWFIRKTITCRFHQTTNIFERTFFPCFFFP